MPTSVLTSKGQTTIPKEIRDYLGLVTGTRIDFTIQPSGEVVLKPVTRDIRTLMELLHRPDQRPVSLEEMDEAIRTHRTP
jgi:AbrB family looped-hinge helix DNA binding protein